MKKISRILWCMVYIIGIPIILWVVASWVDVIMHNASDHVYQSWNYFSILLDLYHG